MAVVDGAGPAGENRWRAEWVPVDRRWMGLDRRTLLPAAGVIALLLVAVGILPAIDNAVEVEDPIRAGDVVQVGRDVEFTPVAGSNLIAGVRQSERAPATDYPGTAAVAYEGVVFQVTADAYQGTPAQLLKQIEKNNEGLRGPGGLRVTGEPVTIANADGDEGVAVRFEGVDQTGIIAAFVFGETGVEVEVAGSRSAPEALAPPIAAMLRSVGPVEGSTP